MANQQNFVPGTANMPSSQVEISISCRNVQDKDVFSKSDPMCVFYTKQFGMDVWSEFGRTESVKNTLNPDFVKKFTMNYYFEVSQKLRFDIYDKDSASRELDSHDFLGTMECTLGQIVGSVGNKLEKSLQGMGKKAGKYGTIIVRAEEVGACRETALMQFSGRHLDKKDFFGKSDPYLQFLRSNNDGSWTVVHKTEVIKNTLDPTWRFLEIPLRKLCNGDYDRPIRIECYDWDSDGGHDFIGACQITMKELTTGNVSSKSYDLINPKKVAKKKNYKNSGVLNLNSIRIEQEYTFLDFIQGGMQINFTVAIDFTASNGDPSTPQSLHYRDQYRPNQYAQALLSVGEIVQDYDSDKMFPALGFGARLPNGKVSHEFFLNGNPSDPHCNGLSGLMEAYNRSLQSVQLYGPTNFSPVINHVARFADAYKNGSNYFILLIITDGVITDMDQTILAIIRASSLPMSIIIVGVGDADFDAMEELDSDDKKLSIGHSVAERDIVQFVPFRDFQRKYQAMSKEYLAKEVLAEVPTQVTSYMKRHGIKPQPPQKASPSAAPAPPPPSSQGGAPP